MLRWFEHSRVYRPSRDWDASGADLGRPWEDLIFPAIDGVRLSGWFFPVAANSPRAHLAVLICHGNGGNISHRLELCRVLLRTGMNVLLFDYRGYGHSEGASSEEGTYADAQGAHGWLRQRGFAPENILAYGDSLGGGVASELALREQVFGLVLQSTFTSIPDIGSEFYPWLPVRRIGTIHYDTISKLPRIKAPVLIMHSRDDEVVRFRHAERNFAAAREPKLFWEIGGDHNHAVSSDPERYWKGLETFLAMVEGSPEKSRGD
jgi:fermentation-respiration switch protein FrsA (DUF1100 family)